MDQINNLFKNIGSTTESIVEERLYIVSALSGVLFYILANTKTFGFMEKLFLSIFKPLGINLKLSGNNLVMFHSLVYMILMAFILHLVLNPVVETIRVFLDNGGQEIEEETL